MKLNKIVMGVSAVLMAGATSAWAATATVAVSGTVPDSTSATVGGPIPALGDVTSGKSDFLLATLTEKCNKKNGYTVSITTANAGNAETYRLVGGTTAETITYTLTHGGHSFVKDLDSHDYPKTSGGGDPFDLKLSLAADNYSADTYTDTITITLVGK